MDWSLWDHALGLFWHFRVEISVFVDRWCSQGPLRGFPGSMKGPTAFPMLVSSVFADRNLSDFFCHLRSKRYRPAVTIESKILSNNFVKNQERRKQNLRSQHQCEPYTVSSKSRKSILSTFPTAQIEQRHWFDCDQESTRFTSSSVGLQTKQNGSSRATSKFSWAFKKKTIQLRSFLHFLGSTLG